MKFWLAWGVYALFGALLAAGMVLAHTGNGWLLIAALGIYGVLMYHFGCRQGSAH